MMAGQCGKCGMVSYCSAGCQKNHWPIHKQECKHKWKQYKKEEQRQALKALLLDETLSRPAAIIPAIIEYAKKGLIPLDDCIAIPALANPEMHLTPLMLACQCKNFNKQLGTQLSSADVKQLIVAGADVNVRNPVSKVNALFLAVKYTDLDTVKMLIEANIDTSARNKYNRDAFYNAVEMARDPEMLSYLLSQGFSVDDTANFGDKNAAEHMLCILRPALTGWKILGPPSPKIFVRCFQALLDAGCRITHEDAILYIKITREGIKPREKRAFEGEAIEQVQKDPCRMAAVHAYFGSEFPIKRTPAKWLTNETQSQHHDTGMLEEKRRRFQDNMGGFYSCSELPTFLLLSDRQSFHECQVLSLSCDISTAKFVLHNYSNSIATRINKDRGSVRMATAATNHIIGPYHIKKSGNIQTGGFDEAERDRLMKSGRSVLFETPRDGPAMIHVTLPSIYGHTVPILASICTQSSVTVVPKALADELGLPYTNLRNKMALSGISGVVNGEYSLLQGITIHLSENVQVTLRTAVCVDGVDRLQFGSDFFNQAAFTMLDFFTFPRWGEEEQEGKGEIVPPSVASAFRNKKDSSKECEMVSLHGSGFGMMFTRACCEKSRNEELRFYTKDDQIVVLPIYHGYPGGCANETYTVTLHNKAKFDQCNWCGRLFPGFKRCGGCKKAYYCSTACQRHDWPTHKLTDSHAK